jgi:hypothetical protein
LFERYLAVHTGADSTKKMLRWKLDKAEAVFGHRRADSLTTEELLDGKNAVQHDEPT